MTPRTTSTLRRVLLVFGGWTLYAIVAASVFHAWRSGTGEPTPPWFGLVRFWLITAWLWALLTFPIISAARRWPITAATWPMRIPLHLLFAVITHVTHECTLWLVHPYVRPGPRGVLQTNLFGTLFLDLFVYAALLAIVHAVDAQRQAFRLRTELLEAELHVMRMQLQPHFLFNTLNAVSELVHSDPARAEQALARLGDLLRWSLQTARLQEVTLRDELAALENYIDIQRLRHEDAVAFQVQADPAVLDLAVPSLLLQPLVENAIRHGVRGRSSGLVSVSAGLEGDQLTLVVTDDGRGMREGAHEGTGLRTTRARLAGLYGKAHRIRIGAGTRGGTVVEVRIPARPAPADHAGSLAS